MPNEPADIYADGFKIVVSGFGSSIHFHLSDADRQQDAAAGELFPSHRIATIRMTPEMLKGLAFILCKQVLFYERGNPRIELPSDAMQRMATSGITREEWDRFWGYT
jgi:hypothetical protein